MEIFRELNKKGYKHYYGGTIEELDTMDKNNPHLHSEIMQVIMWLYEKYRIWVVVNITIDDSWYFELYNLKDKRNAEILINNKEITEFRNSPTEAYQEAIKHTLDNFNMTFEQFKEDWETIILKEKPSYVRKGQSLMNYLAKVWIEEYKRLTSFHYYSETNIDCFYNDDLIPNTLKHLKKVWKNNET